LIEKGIIDRIPKEPHGESYVLRDGKVYSTLKRSKS
jgi:hypothetical protein